MKLLGWIPIVSLIVVAIIIEGLVLGVLWDWFMIPLGLKTISVGHAIGLATLSGILTHQMHVTKPMDEMTDGEKLQTVKGIFNFLFLRPVVALLIGWIAHSYI